jgi:hypothetical protein
MLPIHIKDRPGRELKSWLPLHEHIKNIPISVFSVFILLTQTQIMLETVTSVAAAILATQMHDAFCYIKNKNIATHISRYTF